MFYFYFFLTLAIPVCHQILYIYGKNIPSNSSTNYINVSTWWILIPGNQDNTPRLLFLRRSSSPKILWQVILIPPAALCMTSKETQSPCSFCREPKKTLTQQGRQVKYTFNLSVGHCAGRPLHMHHASTTNNLALLPREPSRFSTETHSPSSSKECRP